MSKDQSNFVRTHTCNIFVFSFFCGNIHLVSFLHVLSYIPTHSRKEESEVEERRTEHQEVVDCRTFSNSCNVRTIAALQPFGCLNLQVTLNSLVFTINSSPNSKR